MNNAGFDYYFSKKREQDLELELSDSLISDADTPFASDYETVITSPAFRRLQDKTQVFPLERDDFIHTRLTHSLEVMMVAKKIINQIALYYSKIKKNLTAFEKNFKKSKDDVIQVLEVASLLHDIGNPPFGHIGEYIIREWFAKEFQLQEKPNQSKIEINFKEEYKKDFINFEGNAQALRVIYQLHNINNGNMNLTYAVISTIMKYTANSKEINKENILTKKLGYFCSEKEFVESIRKETKTENIRNPLTYILEAADDIAYLTADIEDAIKKKIINFNELKKQIDAILEETIEKNKKSSETTQKELKNIEEKIEIKQNQLQEIEKSKRLLKKHMESNKKKEIENLLSEKEIKQEDIDQIEWDNKNNKRIKHIEKIKENLNSSKNYHEYIKSIRNSLIDGARFGYTNSYINQNKKEKGLLEHDDVFVKELYEELNEQLRKNVFTNRNILKIEIAARNILNFLLDTFVPAAIYAELDEAGKQLVIKDKQMEQKLLALIPSTCKAACVRALKDEAKTKDDDDKLYYKLLMVTDFISGMTDSYAHNLYLELSGNKL